MEKKDRQPRPQLQQPSSMKAQDDFANRAVFRSLGRVSHASRFFPTLVFYSEALAAFSLSRLIEISLIDRPRPMIPKT